MKTLRLLAAAGLLLGAVACGSATSPDPIRPVDPHADAAPQDTTTARGPNTLGGGN